MREPADPGGAFALNIQAVSKLKYTARAAPQHGLAQASRQFEAIFIQKMLHGMRAAIPKSGLLHSSQSDTYHQMMDRQWAQTLARRGMGLADMMTEQLRRPTPGDAAVDNIAAATPRPLAASEAIAAAQPSAPRAAANRAAIAETPVAAAAGEPVRPAREPLRRGASQPARVDTGSAARARTAPAADASLPGYADTFVDTMRAPAARASRATGIPQRLIIAQAALETGWGRHETVAANGRNSHNVFNIKAAGWPGKTTRAATREFENGRLQRTHAGFRLYDSYADAFDDYARLMQQSPRYAGVRRAPTAAAAAARLQSTGYATDPAYADKLVAIMDRIGSAASPQSRPRVADVAPPPVSGKPPSAAG